jgi:hypothetical protein
MTGPCPTCHHGDPTTGSAGPSCPAVIAQAIRPTFRAGCDGWKPRKEAAERAEWRAQGAGAIDGAQGQAGGKAAGRKARTPNKTEAEYARYHLRGMDARFEGITFRMANGHAYTPDWIVVKDGRPVECHECKGGYALHSQQRARLAFDQARVEWPGLRWVWATKRDGGWEIA